MPGLRYPLPALRLDTLSICDGPPGAPFLRHGYTYGRAPVPQIRRGALPGPRSVRRNLQAPLAVARSVCDRAGPPARAATRVSAAPADRVRPEPLQSGRP